MRRGKVWLVNLDSTLGAEIKKTRPAVLVNDDAVEILPLKVIRSITAWNDRYAVAPWIVRLEPTSLLVTGATWTEADRQAFWQGHEILMENLGRSLASRCLEPSDEECLRLGLPAGWRPTEDQIARHRLGTPAWMVSRGLLEVRIALPLDHLGPPYQAGRGGGFFHPKAGTLHNGKGNLIFFHMMRDCCWSHGTISCGRLGRDEVLGANQPWDAVLVDKAHAARRQVFRRHEPNLLLSLLQGLHRQRLYRTLWLLTATPMQLDPSEVHDLLLLCGMNDQRWREWHSESAFTRLFIDLSQYGRHREARRAVHRMTTVAVDAGAEPLRPDQVPKGWDAFHWQRFVDRTHHHRPLMALDLQRYTGEQVEAMTPYLARQTPLGVYMFR